MARLLGRCDRKVIIAWLSTRYEGLQMRLDCVTQLSAAAVPDRLAD